MHTHVHTQALVHVHGIILAGGKARRMGGIDKGLASFKGQAMVAHVLDRLRPQVASITICANRNISDYKQHHSNVIHDDGEAYRGPLIGILSAMQHISRTCHARDWVALAPCDAPLLARDLISKLTDNLNVEFSKHSGLLPYDGQRYQPLFSMLPITVIDQLQQAILQQKFKVSDWLLSLQPKIVDLSEFALSFRNINFTEQLNSYSDEQS